MHKLVGQGNVAGTARAGIQREYRRSVIAWLHLARTYIRLDHAHQTLLAEHGLTPSQFDVLSHLAAEPGMSQTELAGRLLVTKGNVAGLIDRLERSGLVERCPDPDDRRSNRLHITESGRRAFEAAAPVLEAQVAEQFEALDDDALDELMRLLARVDRSLRRG